MANYKEDIEVANKIIRIGLEALRIESDQNIRMAREYFYLAMWEEFGNNFSMTKKLSFANMMAYQVLRKEFDGCVINTRERINKLFATQLN